MRRARERLDRSTMFKAALSSIKDALPEEVKEAAKKRVNQWKGISPDEALVREATNSDKWGPHGEQLKAIARLTHDGRWPLVQSVLEERMKLRGERWRQVYKALSVIEYLVANGTDRVPRDVQSSRYLDGLLTFEYRDARGKDEGVNVRHRAEKIKALIEDPRSIEEAREKAARNRGKYSGMSSVDARQHRSTGSLSNTEYRLSNTDSGSFSKNGSRGFGDATSTVARETRETECRDVTPSVTTQQNHATASSQSATFKAPTSGHAGPSSSSSHAQSTEPRSDAFSAQPTAGAVPKIIFRETPIRREEAPQQVSAFEPPPRASSAAIQAVNYSSGVSGATAAPAVPTSAGSIEDLLGGLSVPSAPVTSSAPVTNPTSSLADLDSLYGAPPSMPQAAPAQTQTIGMDPFAAFSAPPNTVAHAVPHAPANQFGFAPPLVSGMAFQHVPVTQPVAPQTHSNDPFGLSSFGSPTATAARVSGSHSPRKPANEMDALASLTADMGLGSKSTQNTPMGGSLI